MIYLLIVWLLALILIQITEPIFVYVISLNVLCLTFSWVGAITGVVSLVIMFPGIFHEFNVAKKEHEYRTKKNQGNVGLACTDIYSLFFKLFVR